MQKINWENGTVVSEAYVEIDGVQHQVTPRVVTGTTPLNASNLNLMQDNIETEFENLEEYINKKDILTITLTADVSISETNTRQIITGFEVYEQIGDKLSLINDKIVIGSGVKKILVSYSARTRAKSNSTGLIYTYLDCIDNTDNLTSPVITQEVSIYNVANAETNVSHTPILLSVQEGAKIQMACYGEAGAKIRGISPVKGSFAWTTITVEVVEYE